MDLQLEKIKIILGNFVLAGMINLHLVNYALVVARGSTTGFSTTLYLGFFVFSIVVWMIQGKLKLDFRWLIVFALLILWHLCNASVSRINLLMLCAYVGMPFFIISNVKYSANRVLIWTMLISIVFIPGFPIMLARTKYGIVDVDVAYSVLPSIIAGIVHFAYYRNSIKRIEWPIYLIPLYYMLQLFFNGLRGPLTCILITSLLVSIFKFDIDDCLQIRKLNRGLWILFVTAIILTFFLEFFLQLVVNIFQLFNIDAYFITKTIRLLNAGDVSNGRNNIWGIAWNGFLRSPIWGNGFDSFQYHTGIPYPHNFILQSLYDGGILFFIPMALIFIFGIYRAIKSGIKDNIALLIFFFGFGLVYSLLSQDMFNIFYLWTIVAFLLMQQKNIQYLNTEGEKKND